MSTPTASEANTAQINKIVESNPSPIAITSPQSNFVTSSSYWRRDRLHSRKTCPKRM
jgi:hypothetical protein